MIKKSESIDNTLEQLKWWLEIIRKQTIGFSAMAEANSESCDTSWLAMHYGLLDMLDMEETIKATLERISERMQEMTKYEKK